jgi:hypothetical protein
MHLNVLKLFHYNLNTSLSLMKKNWKFFDEPNSIITQIVIKYDRITASAKKQIKFWRVKKAVIGNSNESKF